jgi:hypothetical protein
MATEILRPDGDGDYSNIEDRYPWTDYHYEVVDEEAPDDAGSFLTMYSTTEQKDAYTLQATSIPSGSTINSVKVYFRIWELQYQASFRPYLRLGSNETAGTEVSTNGNDEWATHSEVLSRPGGGSWQVSDLNSLQVAIGLKEVTSDPYCTQVYVEVDYTAATPKASSDTGSGADAIVSLGVEPKSHQWEITADSNQHNDYGLGYPLTYAFIIPSGITAGKVYYKFSPDASYEQLTEKTTNDFFNGINAVRFDFANDRAYVSIAFDADSDKIYLKFTDGEDNPIDVGSLFIADYYDNRGAVVCVTADDLSSDSTDSFNLAMDACQARNIWITVGVITDPSSPPNWSNLQSQINQGSVEAAAHSRTHPHIPYGDYDAEIGGSLQDIKDNVDLPSIYKKGSTEYVWTWIEPYGESDATQRAKCGQYKYLADRSIADQDVFSTWDATNGLFNRAGRSMVMGTDGETDAAVLNAKFDSVKNAGGIYHLMCHPEDVDWSENEYAIEHLDYIKDKKDVWYVGFGALYQYRYVCVQADVDITPMKTSSETGSGTEASTQTATLAEAETGGGVDAIVPGNPSAMFTKDDTGSGVEGLLARILGLTETGAGADAVAQAQAILEGADTGAGADAYVSLEKTGAKTSSDAGSGVEGTPVPTASLAGSETGSGIDATIARLLAAFDTGYGVEAADVEVEEMFKELFATELGEGVDALVVRRSISAGSEGTKFFGGGYRPPHRAS